MTDANKTLVPRHKIMISKIVFFVGFLHTYDLFFNIGQMRFFSPDYCRQPLWFLHAFRYFCSR